MMEVCEVKGDVYVEVKKSDNILGQCFFGYGKLEGSKESYENGVDEQGKERKDENIEVLVGGKCFFGYDFVFFKIGFFSCVLC